MPLKGQIFTIWKINSLRGKSKKKSVQLKLNAYH
jgi:hypothetical protein